MCFIVYNFKKINAKKKREQLVAILTFLKPYEKGLMLSMIIQINWR